MKKSVSEWDFEAFLQPQSSTTTSPSGPPLGFGLRDEISIRDGGEGGNFITGEEEPDGYALNHNSVGDLVNCFLWSQNHAPKHSADTGSKRKSSVYVESPTSPQKAKFSDIPAPLASSGSEQSDDESLDVDAGSCGQSTDVVDLKRMRRKVSNRESARRSRKRKQAQLADLELQVDQLRGENASLYKQLMEASQHLTEAATDNRVLKSDVETLRVKVKMAEDLVTRGSLAFTLNSLLQPAAPAPAPHFPSARHVCRAVDHTLAGAAASHVNDLSIKSTPGQSQPLVKTSSLDQLRGKFNADMGGCGADGWQWPPDAPK
ncbi:basic leucine zipper 9 [Wolffia australiana]